VGGDDTGASFVLLGGWRMFIPGLELFLRRFLNAPITLRWPWGSNELGPIHGGKIGGKNGGDHLFEGGTGTARRFFYC